MKQQEQRQAPQDTIAWALGRLDMPQLPLNAHSSSHSTTCTPTQNTRTPTKPALTCCLHASNLVSVHLLQLWVLLGPRLSILELERLQANRT